MRVTNENYCATIVKIHSLVKLDGLDNLLGAPMFGFTALVQKDYSPDDLYVLFTAETQLSEQFCHENNLYDKSELNKDKTKKGYVNSKRRVRAVKLRGHLSSALLMKLDSLSYLGEIDFKEGDSFNEINGVEICRKYVIRQTQGTSGPKVRKLRNRQLLDSKLVPEHIDTANWWKNEHKVNDEQEIIVSVKLHGSSVRLANQKIVTYPKWLTPYLAKLYDNGYGNWRLVKFVERMFRSFQYSPIAGSRRVIKIRDLDRPSYYTEDIYNQALDRISHLIPKGWVLYGELIGWSGEKAIQPNYTYNLHNTQFELYLYRIAIVNEDGLSVDLSHDQMVSWAKENGVKTCPEIWRGKKKDFDVSIYMDKSYHKEGLTQCVPLCDSSPCDEGVVIRIEGLTPVLYKAKSQIFLGHETKVLDSEVVTLEDE